MIKAVIFDLDNTLVDFMLMKKQAIDAAINAMRDAGLKLSTDEIRQRIDQIYKERGIWDFIKHILRSPSWSRWCSGRR